MDVEERELYLSNGYKKLGGVYTGTAGYLNIPRVQFRLPAVIVPTVHPLAMRVEYALAYMILDEQPIIIRNQGDDNSEQHDSMIEAEMRLGIDLGSTKIEGVMLKESGDVV